jgi:hypothetical protein
MSDVDDTTNLSPTQAEVLDRLGATRDERPTFPPDLRDRLRTALSEALADLAGELDPDDPLTVNKHDLATVHGCELRYLTERDRPFEWSPPLARGTVAHKAIELSLHERGRPVPLVLVDEALDRLERSDASLAGWLATCSEAERAEVRALANERVAGFLECFPPLRRTWMPVTESRLRVELLDGRVSIAGRSDLTLGRAEGTTAGKVIIDFKTGATSTTHVDDLRLYALVEALRTGVPPRLTASLYLDSGTIHTEVITEGVLDAAVARTADGIRKVHELDVGTRAPEARASRRCRWCPALATCATGRAFLGELDDDGDRFDDD